MSIIALSSDPAKPSTFGKLKTKVARIIGAHNGLDELAAAGEFVNDRIIEFNTRLYECNKLETQVLAVTWDASVGALQATLPTAFYKEHEFRLVDVNGAKLSQLSYLDWAEFQHTFNLPNSAIAVGATPTYYTLLNVFEDGKIRIFGGDANSQTFYVKGTYYRRFPLLSDDAEVLNAPREIERALVLGAQADMLRVYNPGPLSMATEALAQRAWDRFAQIDTKHVDMKPRIRLAPLTTRRIPTDGTDYIKL